MSDITIDGPVTDKGTGLYPMTRPAEVTVENPVSNVPTGAVPGPPDERTYEFAAPGEPTGAYPTLGPQTVHQWPSQPDEDEPTVDVPEVAAEDAEDKVIHQPAKKAAKSTKKRGS